MRVLVALVVVLGSLAIVAGNDAASSRGPPDFRVLVFTKTAAYRHDSIPAAIAAVERLGAQNDLVVDATEDASAFTTAGSSACTLPRTPRCRACTETLTVHTARGAFTTRGSAAGTHARLVSRSLPRGRWHFMLVHGDTRLQGRATVRVG